MGPLRLAIAPAQLMRIEAGEENACAIATDSRQQVGVRVRMEVRVEEEDTNRMPSRRWSRPGSSSARSGVVQQRLRRLVSLAYACDPNRRCECTRQLHLQHRLTDATADVQEATGGKSKRRRCNGLSAK